MTIHVRYQGREKEIETLVNLRNCFDKETNPTAADSMLPVIYNHDGDDSVIGTMDYVVVDDNETVYIMNMPPLDGIYDHVFENIESMSLKIKQIEGAHGYLFILTD